MQTYFTFLIKRANKFCPVYLRTDPCLFAHRPLFIKIFKLGKTRIKLVLNHPKKNFLYIIGLYNRRVI